MATTTQMREPGPVPEHVPAELVWQHDFVRFATAKDDPFRRLGELHDGPDILWVRDLGDGLGGGRSGWLLTRHALIREVLADTGNFMSGGDTNLMSVIGLNWPLIPLELDPPLAQKYRRVLEPFFAPKNIDALDAAIRRTCFELIDNFTDPDGCEFVSDFAERFPSYVFLDLMGMPRERLADFLAWERGMIRGTPNEIVAAMTSIRDYLEDFIREQRHRPTSRLMQGIIQAELQDGRPLTDTEMLSMCYLLYIGGLDTVYSTLSWCFWHLAQDQPLQDRLRENPADVSQATEELLRAFSAASSGRRVKSDMDFHGVKMKAGERVIALLSLASRDPRSYPDPHRIDIDRKPRHIAFGTGPHTCLGLRLAKREIKIVLETFLTRYRNIRLAPGDRHLFHVGSVFGIDRLMLQWDPAAGEAVTAE